MQARGKRAGRADCKRASCADHRDRDPLLQAHCMRIVWYMKMQLGKCEEGDITAFVTADRSCFCSFAGS